MKFAKSVLLGLAVLLLLVIPIAAAAEAEAEAKAGEEPMTREALTETVIKAKFFREPVGILWTYFGEDTKSYALQMRHGFISHDVLPNPFGQMGLIPDAIIGDITYESNPYGETGDAIWTEVTAYYDSLFGYDWIEGRATYSDILLDSYIGAGLGFVPITDSWAGVYYLGNDGFELHAELAYPITDEMWSYFIYKYYTETEWNEAQLGIRYNDLYLRAENRLTEWIYAIGVTIAID